MKKNNREIHQYDQEDTTPFIDSRNRKSLSDLGFKAPKEQATTVISIRLPTRMLNTIRAFSSEHDLPYQAVIKMFLQEEIKRHKLA
jgi:predicted DNA binding CopG/RHH family protein